MPSSLHQRILELLRVQPLLVVELLAAAEPERRGLWQGRRWRARVADATLRATGLSEDDSHRLADLVILLCPRDAPDRTPTIVVVVECQLGPDPDKYFAWVDYLAAARREHGCAGRVLVLSPLDTVIAWAEGLFVDEPWLTPRLVGRTQVPRVDDHGRALRQPELAVLSAVFHGPHADGLEVVLAAALALRRLPRHRRRQWVMLLEDVLPEEMMPDVRRIALEEAKQAADEWMRTRGPYRIGHREGREEGLLSGREEGLLSGREEGLLSGRREALEWLLEARSLTPTATEKARIAACDELEMLERWCIRAKTATRVADLFD